MEFSLSHFDYPLPEGLIAQTPCPERDRCRLLVLNGTSTEHSQFDQLHQWLRPGDLLVLNNTKVLPARLEARNTHNGLVDILLLSPTGKNLEWECLVRPAKKLIKAKNVLTFAPCTGNSVTGHFERVSEYIWRVRFEGLKESDFHDWLQTNGTIPLPPYINRLITPEDSDTYQTVFAKELGSAAAPTAGLHFTESLLASLSEKGIENTALTLHVGYGTFSPIREENLDLHRMHVENYSISESAWKKIEQTRRSGGRVIAVGTTSVRALESVPTLGLRGSTRLFIRPGFKFQWVDGLITNFHLPKSSLLVLVSAFGGYETLKAAYQQAMEKRYRFFSYGDAMLILPQRIE